jgi:hypothetical protein
MKKEPVHGIKGWLLVYLICSIPLLVFYTGAFAGWVLDYPLWLALPILVILAIPLVLILFKSDQAPKWNIIELWIIAILLPSRIISGALMGNLGRAIDYLIPLVSVILFPIVWAIIWTMYFQKSVRVQNTFSRGPQKKLNEQYPL